MAGNALTARTLLVALKATLVLAAVGAAQEVPPRAIAAVVQHFAAKGSASIALALDGIEDRTAVREAVRDTDVVTGLESELVSCDASTRSRRLVTSRDRVLRLVGVERSGAGLVLQVIVTAPHMGNGVARVSRQMRILTLARTADGWEVVRDEMGVTS